jgi:hypothetical protein
MGPCLHQGLNMIEKIPGRQKKKKKRRKAQKIKKKTVKGK